MKEVTVRIALSFLVDGDDNAVEENVTHVLNRLNEEFNVKHMILSREARVVEFDGLIDAESEEL
jgi:hypothetical protein